MRRIEKILQFSFIVFFLTAVAVTKEASGLACLNQFTQQHYEIRAANSIPQELLALKRAESFSETRILPEDFLLAAVSCIVLIHLLLLRSIMQGTQHHRKTLSKYLRCVVFQQTIQ